MSWIKINFVVYKIILPDMAFADPVKIKIHHAQDDSRTLNGNIKRHDNTSNRTDPSHLSVLKSPSLNAINSDTCSHDMDIKRHSVGEVSTSNNHPDNKNNAKLYKLRDDIESLYAKCKNKGNKINRSMSMLKSRLQSNKDESQQKQKIKVEYIDSGSSECLNGDDSSDILELPDHNYSPSLMLTDLCDGCFTAKISMAALPRGDITIRIRNYKMEIIVARRPSLVADNHRITCPMRHGDIDIPIYVNPASLQFELDDSDNVLHVSGYTKGYYGNRKLSLSSQNLDDERNSLRSPKRKERGGSFKFVRSKSCTKPSSSSSGSPDRSLSPRRSLTVCHPPRRSFKQKMRAN